MAERAAEFDLAAKNDEGSLQASENENAGIGQRCLAYVVDSILLFGFCMAFGAAAFLVILIGTDMGRGKITDDQEWGFVVCLLAAFPAWLIFNVLLMSRRGHTVGQYVMGLRAVTEFGLQPSWRHIALYWFSLHPLLFHPLLMLPWGLLAALGITLASSALIFVLALAVVFLCLVTPVVNLVFALLDPQRRGIHDRLARIKVVQL